MKLRVQKKPDKYNMDLLSEDEPNSGIWNSITRYTYSNNSTKIIKVLHGTVDFVCMQSDLL